MNQNQKYLYLITKYNFDLLAELYTLPQFQEWQKDKTFDLIYDHVNGGKAYIDWTPYHILEWLIELGWHILIIPEFYKTGVNYNVQVLHYNPDREFAAIDNFCDTATCLYGDNGELPTLEEAITYGIKWCFNIIKTNETEPILNKKILNREISRTSFNEVGNPYYIDDLISKD